MKLQNYVFHVHRYEAYCMGEVLWELRAELIYQLRC